MLSKVFFINKEVKTLRGDFHTHTYYSDGELSPKELANRAAALKLDYTALTDHDTFFGTDELKSECAVFGIKTITGVEISTYDESNTNTEVHVLGYNIDHKADTPVSRGLVEVARVRLERIEESIAKMKQLGIEINIQEVLAQATKALGRKHLAAVMVNHNIVGSVEEAFARYLSSGRPAFVKKFYYKPREAVEAIKRSGGIAVLAHPGRIKTDEQSFENLIIRLKDSGLDGIESYYPAHNIDMIKRFKKIADKYELINTNGSDTHYIKNGVSLNYELEQKTIEVLGLK